MSGIVRLCLLTLLFIIHLELAKVHTKVQTTFAKYLLDLSQGRALAAFERSIDNHVSRLRRKIEADPSNPALIKTVWGGGYTLAAEVRAL